MVYTNGNIVGFLSENFIFVYTSLPEMIAALAFTDLEFKYQENSFVFSSIKLEVLFEPEAVP